jgi:ABC-type uncharacterized transport system substrate-binding protein
MKRILFVKKLLLISMLLVMPVLQLKAHPHVSINAYTHYYFNESGLMGFYVQWIYDPMFSSQIIYECDIDMNNFFSPEEVEQVKTYYFSQLETWQYYLTLKIEGVEISVPEPLNFNAEIDVEDGVVMFSFYIPVAKGFSASGTRFMVNFTDPTNYVAFICPQRTISSVGETASISGIEINRFGIISFTFHPGNKVSLR